MECIPLDGSTMEWKNGLGFGTILGVLALNNFGIFSQSVKERKKLWEKERVREIEYPQEKRKKV